MAVADAGVGAPNRRSPSFLNGIVLANPAIGLPILVSLIAWITLIAWSRMEGGLTLCTTAGPNAGFRASVREQMYLAPPVRQFAEWCVMAAAMMLPLALPAMAQVSARLFRNLRLPAILLAITGYLAAWFVFGLPAIAVIVALRATSDALEAGLLISLLTAGATILWCTSPLRVRTLRQCHIVPAPCGSSSRIIFTSGIFGIRLGMRCIVVCGPAMVALPILGAGLSAMFFATHVLLAERLSPAAQVIGSALALGSSLMAPFVGL